MKWVLPTLSVGAPLCCCWALAVAALCAAAPARAQAPDTPSTTAAEASSDGGYQDRYIDNGLLPPDIVFDNTPTNGNDGLARSVRVDQVASVLSSSGGGPNNDVAETGVVLSSRWDTVHYGAFSLDATGLTSSSGHDTVDNGQNGMLALRQWGMPLDDGWLVDNGIGNLNTQEIALARVQPRFYLPTTPMRGVTSDWRGPSDLELVASVGEPGTLSGIAVPSFNGSGGTTYALGGQWDPSEHWTIGAQQVGVRDGQNYTAPWGTSDRVDSDATLASVAWQEQGARSQLTLLSSEASGENRGTGAWLDTSLGNGWINHAFGVFRIDPDLTWGEQPIANDVQGAYYRFGLESRRLLADAGVDVVDSVSGNGGRTVFFTSDARYQLSADLGIGGAANVSDVAGASRWMLQSYVDQRNGFGIGSVLAGYAHAADAFDATLNLGQTWEMPAGTYLNTSLSIERHVDDAAVGADAESTVVGLALAGGGQLGHSWTFNGNLRLLHTIQGRGAPAVSSNISLGRQLSPNWTLLATYYETRIGSWNDLTVTSPLAPPIETQVPEVEERGVFLTVRYQHAGGRQFAPLGGGPGTGAGELSGYVYLDANQNGRMDAGETGVERITVLLDHRYSALTDASGHYDFGAVAAGRHTVEVVMDNLPLPWTFNDQAPVQVDVRTRGQTMQNFAATRMH